jgi:kynurenine formamidase
VSAHGQSSRIRWRRGSLLFRTGWDRFWGQEEYFGAYPVIGPDVVDYLIASGKKGIGLDVIGVDPIADANLRIHRRLLQTGKFVVIENLTNLEQAGGELFTFCALPLHYRDADGSPIRAVGIFD